MKEYKNILVINLMHLGDLMLVTPVLRTLRANHPQAQISLLADKKLADLVKLNKHIDRCLFIDKKGKDNNLSSFIKYIFNLRKEKFDLVINLHRNERASALAAFSGGKRIIGYAKPGFSLFFDQVMPNLKAIKHQIHSHFDVLWQGEVIEKTEDGGLEMWLSAEDEATAEKLWQETYPENMQVVAFNIGASWQTKRWQKEYFASCADELIEKGYGIAFLGGPMDIELVNECLAQMKYAHSEAVGVFTGRLTLGELGALLKRCSLFLTTDSGPMHIGVAQSVPIVTMFGASPVPGFYPYDARDVLIKTPEKCHPCGIHECPLEKEKNMLCMKNIPVQVVMKYVYMLLEKYGNMAGHHSRQYGKYQCKVIDLGKEEI